MVSSSSLCVCLEMIFPSYTYTVLSTRSYSFKT